MIVDAARTVLDRLANGASVEATPDEISHVDLARSLSPGTRVYITRIATRPLDETVHAAIALRAAGLEPVPHLAARSIRDVDELRAHVSALNERAGVKEVLVIAGSQRTPRGTFDNALDVLDTGILEDCAIRRIGVAGHPEGHPHVDDERLDAAILRKNAYAKKYGIEMYFITQFFFDAAPLVGWEKRIRALGNRLDVRPGLHGLSGLTSLIGHAVACDVGPSLAMLADHLNLLQLAVVRTPDKLFIDIANAAREDPAARFGAVHLFPLGGLARTLEWLATLRMDRFSIDAGGRIVLRDDLDCSA